MELTTSLPVRPDLSSGATKGKPQHETQRRVFVCPGGLPVCQSRIQGRDKSIMTLSTMKSLEEKLPPETLLRIQRSYIISLDKIDSVSKSSVWIGETEITIGAQYKSSFQEVIGGRL